MLHEAHFEREAWENWAGGPAIGRGDLVPPAISLPPHMATLTVARSTDYVSPVARLPHRSHVAVAREGSRSNCVPWGCTLNLDVALDPDCCSAAHCGGQTAGLGACSKGGDAVLSRLKIEVRLMYLGLLCNPDQRDGVCESVTLS